MSELLVVRDLETQFKVRAGRLHAVNGVSFNLRQGEMLGVVGESGCGKSVTMMSLIRLLPPSASITNGTVMLEGLDLVKANKEQINAVRGSKIAMIFQDPMTSLNPFLKIGIQLSEGLMYHRKMGKKEAYERCAQYLDLVGISNSRQRLEEYPHQLSGGMRQRVMIAMALVCEPKIIIADEPTTALDVTIQAQIVELVKELRDKLDASIIWITHDLSLLAGMVDRILVMYAGCIVEEACLRDLYKDPRHPYTIGLLESIPRIKDHENRRLKSIPGQPPNLLEKPTSCPFASRCTFKTKRCEREVPSLASVPGDVEGSSHRIACWVDTRGRQ
ncbi:MAG TPA: ABC transporter ATP-binding protein [Rectinema sp.]|jgi:oligopeptide/dipeptide ABC transporter ATP-binding protein|nr:ABC transporter ATP-binding protein [Rectinema sp.]